MTENKTTGGSQVRNTRCSLVFNTGTQSQMTVEGEYIISVHLTESYNSSDGIAIGATCSNSLTVEMIVPDGLAFQTASIDLYSITDESQGQLHLGKFYVCGYSTENNYRTVTLECYDPFFKTEEKYVPSQDAPASIADVANDIAVQCGFEMGYDFTGEQDITIPWYGDYTCRQMIGYIAGLLGKNASFDREGRLIFSWYQDTAIEIERNQQYMDQFKLLKAEPQCIQSLISGTGDEMISVGEGFGISFENPYMTRQRLEAIYENIKGFEFQPCSVAYRGNLNIHTGTIINIKDAGNNNVKACVMEHDMILGGGMSATVYSYGKEEMSYSFESGTSSKTLSAMASRMDKAVMMTKEIKDVKGGVLQIIDSSGDGINDSLVIRMAHTADEPEDTRQKAKYILINENGIGLSDDGGHFFKTAINSSGICTEAIDVKSIFAQEIGVSGVEFSDMLHVHEDEQEGMVMTIGSGTNNVIMQQENDQIAFYEKNGEEKVNLCSFGVQAATGKKVITLGSLSIEAWNDGKVTFSTGGEI